MHITITRIGIDWPHEPEYVCDRPFGMDEYQFFRFTTPFEIRTVKGIEIGKPGDCIFHTLKFPNWHKGHGGAFRNDWIHFTGEDVEEIVRITALPVNTIFHPPDSSAVTPAFQVIRREMLRKDLYWEEIIGTKFEELLFTLSRNWKKSREKRLTKAELRNLDSFRDIRLHVHERLHEPWTIVSMAALAHLSASRFAALYTKFFKVSPVEDLIETRIQHAKFLLSNANVSVAIAAEESGFESLAYFSRLFRKRVGCPPRDYYSTSMPEQSSETQE